jgi:hypothetical protein
MMFNARQPLTDETVKGIANGYNLTPPNFMPPSDEVIDEVINLVEKQMEIDFHEEKLIRSLKFEKKSNKSNWFSNYED